MTTPDIGGVAPLFIVRDTAQTLAFYRDQLGFDVTFEGFGDDLVFGIVQRGRAMIMLKDVGVEPLPNAHRHPDARWDAYVYTPDPDAQAAEFAARGVGCSDPLRDTDDNLRGFEIADPDGYVLFFGRPHPGTDDA